MYSPSCFWDECASPDGVADNERAVSDTPRGEHSSRFAGMVSRADDEATIVVAVRVRADERAFNACTSQHGDVDDQIVRLSAVLLGQFSRWHHVGMEWRIDKLRCTDHIKRHFRKMYPIPLCTKRCQALKQGSQVR